MFEPVVMKTCDVAVGAAKKIIEAKKAAERDKQFKILQKNDKQRSEQKKEYSKDPKAEKGVNLAANARKQYGSKF